VSMFTSMLKAHLLILLLSPCVSSQKLHNTFHFNGMRSVYHLRMLHIMAPVELLLLEKIKADQSPLLLLVGCVY